MITPETPWRFLACIFIICMGNTVCRPLQTYCKHTSYVDLIFMVQIGQKLACLLRLKRRGTGVSWCEVTVGENEGYLGKKKRRGKKGEEKRWKKDVCWVWVRESDRSPGWFRSAIRAPLLSARLCVYVCTCVAVGCLCGCLCVVCVTVISVRGLLRVLFVKVCVYSFRWWSWDWLHEWVWIRLSC